MDPPGHGREDVHHRQASEARTPEPTEAATIGVALASGLLLPLGVGRLGRFPRYFMLASMLCLAAALTITLLVNVPINAAEVSGDPNAPPEDWKRIRDRWRLAHAFRTALAVIAFAFQTLAAIGPTAART